MSLTMDTRPGRWVRACPADGSSFTYCDAVGMGDFIPQAWNIDPNDGNQLLKIFVRTDPNGLISSVDTTPAGTVYGPSGETGTILATSTFTGEGETIVTYEPGVGDFSILGYWTVEITGIQVTLKTGDTCSVNFNQGFNGAALAAPAYTIRTTKTSSFAISQIGGSGIIDWGDGSTDEFDLSGGGTETHNYSSSGTYVVKVICAPGDITFLDVSDQQLTGTADFSKLSAVTNLQYDTNPNLSVVNTPQNNSTTPTIHYANGTGISTWNGSGYSSLAGAVRLGSNSSLTDVTIPVTTGTLSELNIQIGNLTTIDWSTAPNITSFKVTDNPNLQAITNAVSSHVMNRYWAYSNDLLSLDNSDLTAIEDDIRINDNPNMTSFTPMTSTGTINIFFADGCDLPYFDTTGWTWSTSATIRLQNNSLTAAEVNQFLVDFDAGIGAGSATITLTGTNAAPDTTSGGYNGSAAKTSLQGKGHTVLTN